jgi:glutathione S-transferase
MHSGFSALRRECSMSIGVRVRLHRRSEALEHDIARVNTLFCEGLSRHGGPLLGGAVFTAVDAFYAPVCFRVETYALELSAPAMDYVSRILARPFVQDWAEAGLAESFRDESHELEIQAAGEWLADLRSQPA